MVYHQLVETVRAYHTAKALAANKPVPVNDNDWLGADLKHFFEEAGELVEVIKMNSPFNKVRGEIADIAINLACIASHYEVEISPAMDEKLAILKERMEEMGQCKEEK
mgnify:FL=1